MCSGCVSMEEVHMLRTCRRQLGADMSEPADDILAVAGSSSPATRSFESYSTPPPTNIPPTPPPFVTSDNKTPTPHEEEATNGLSNTSGAETMIVVGDWCRLQGNHRRQETNDKNTTIVAS
ncbi:hypothetical protein C0Q70_04428 [Pomacea canaliculata]|uniref:Uncharacterized protein n=1 Tax=Pomacea canaliculata TaxID=400727 RepID=A0A2T7PID6_POMCA|nr:hypothetical protein C0Q70_04428 [Pomacea canaliculata]